MKKDVYSQNRGGWSRMLDITCEKCNQHVCFYQKDGPGPLKRIYKDRIIDQTFKAATLKCRNCNHELGLEIIYENENRPAFRLFQDSVKKKVMKSSIVSLL